MLSKSAIAPVAVATVATAISWQIATSEPSAAGAFQLGILVALAVLATAELVLRPAHHAEAALIVAGALLVDFVPLRVYRYLLLSDVLLLAAFLVNQWRMGPQLRIPWLLLVPFGMYLLSHLVSFLRSADPGAGVFTWLHMVFLMAVLVPAVSTVLARRRELSGWVLGSLAISAAVQAALLDLAVWRGLAWTSGTRISGVMGNSAAWVFEAGAIGLAGALFWSRWPFRIASMLGLTVLIPALFFLRARMLWVGVLVGTAVFWCIHARRFWRAGLAVVLAAAALAAAYNAGWLPEGVEARIAATLQGTRSVDLLYRLEVVRLLMPAFSDSPLIGVGVGQSATYLPGHFSAGRVGAIHNVVLHAAVEGGLLAAVGWVLLPVATFVLWRRGRSAAAGRGQFFLIDWAFAALAGMFVGVQFTPAMYEHVTYLLLALLAAQASSNRDHQSVGRIAASPPGAPPRGYLRGGRVNDSVTPKS